MTLVGMIPFLTKTLFLLCTADYTPTTAQMHNHYWHSTGILARLAPGLVQVETGDIGDQQKQCFVKESHCCPPQSL